MYEIENYSRGSWFPYIFSFIPLFPVNLWLGWNPSLASLCTLIFKSPIDSHQLILDSYFLPIIDHQSVHCKFEYTILKSSIRFYWKGLLKCKVEFLGCLVPLMLYMFFQMLFSHNIEQFHWILIVLYSK